ncbi:hypothetical protein B0O99DRAFT_746776 [Bisporella sp. PMI_857]|nr:hypothetical protein B0O99DRAFT_746776 [Bisporella sp. PMI_857]
MAAKIASKDAPMTLGRRQILEQVRIPFHVPPLEMIFSPSILEVLDKQHLRAFVDSLLSKLSHEYPMHDTPSPSFWKLSINGTEEDLENWDPNRLNPDIPILIVSNIGKHLVSITTAPTTRIGSSQALVHEMKSFRLHPGAVFELQGSSHLLLVLRCQTRVKISNRKRGIDETIHTMLVPADYTAAQVSKLVRASCVNGVFEDPKPKDLQADNRSVSELGWKHGTILRLELW